MFPIACEFHFVPLIILCVSILPNTEAVSFLLKHGCKVNTRDGSGLTSMHHAATNNSVLLCTLLHQHEANINSVCVTKQVRWLLGTVLYFSLRCVEFI